MYSSKKEIVDYDREFGKQLQFNFNRRHAKRKEESCESHSADIDLNVKSASVGTFSRMSLHAVRGGIGWVFKRR